MIRVRQHSPSASEDSLLLLLSPQPLSMRYEAFPRRLHQLFPTYLLVHRSHRLLAPVRAVQVARRSDECCTSDAVDRVTKNVIIPPKDVCRTNHAHVAQ